jgi:hypothetical protein
VKIDGTLRGFGSEIRRFVIYTQGQGISPPISFVLGYEPSGSIRFFRNFARA